jgi:hypothetical protein
MFMPGLMRVLSLSLSGSGAGRIVLSGEGNSAPGPMRVLSSSAGNFRSFVITGTRADSIFGKAAPGVVAALSLSPAGKLSITIEKFSENFK